MDITKLKRYMDGEELDALGFQGVRGPNDIYKVFETDEGAIFYKHIGDGTYEMHDMDCWKTGEWE